MVKFKISNSVLILALVFGLFLVVVPKTYGQLIESRPWTTKVGNPAGPAPGGSVNFVYYAQDDPRWNRDVCHYNWAICGPTSIAMIMSSFGDVVTPEDTDNIAARSVQPPIRACGDAPWTGTKGWDRFFALDFFAGAGFHASSLSISMTKENLDIWKNNFIDKGYLILGSATGSRGGITVSHIFVVDDVNPDNMQVHLMDPAKHDPNSFSSAGYWSQATAPWISASGIVCGWVYAYAITRI